VAASGNLRGNCRWRFPSCRVRLQVLRRREEETVGEQARRSQEIVASCRRSDARLGRYNVEPGVEPEPGDSDHDAQNDEDRAVGFKLPADPLLALVQQVAAELVELSLQLNVAGIGRTCLPAANAVRAAHLPRLVIVPRVAPLKRRPGSRA